MTEHRGSSFVHSCVKVPLDPFSRQPTPSYERPRIQKLDKSSNRKINFTSQIQSSRQHQQDSNRIETTSSDDSNVDTFIDFLESIPDYGQVNHLSNEQFKQKLDYLKRKQRLLLKNLKNCFDNDNDDLDVDEKINTIDNKSTILLPTTSTPSIPDKSSYKKYDNENSDLKLFGKKCYLEDSRAESPWLCSSNTFAGLAEDQDLLTYRSKDKASKTARNKEIYSAGKSWSNWSESKSNSDNSDTDNTVETRSLPSRSPKRWHPTVPKPFTFALRDEAEKYMTQTETETEEKLKEKCGFKKKKRVRPIPLTSRIPLYDKLIAAKEERSRIIREESAWSLMSQVKPFRLECDRRAVKIMSRSSPELRTKKLSSSRCSSRFRAKPVPKNLFGTEIYDRMLEDEYFRQLQKKIRAAELMKSSSLPPSMARRERIKSATSSGPRSRNCTNNEFQINADDESSSRLCSLTPAISERSRSVMTDLSTRGSNLAAILRCQATRDKFEREIREKMEEKAKEYAMKMRKTLISRKPAWKEMRTAAKNEHSRELDFRVSLRRDEAREQAERHRLEMEMMLTRVTQIPTLFERHSQGYQTMRQLQSRVLKLERKKKKHKKKIDNSSSLESDDCHSGLLNLPDEQMLRVSPGQSSKSSGSIINKFSSLSSQTPERNKIKNQRGGLRVSINEKAELIQDDEDDDDDRYTCPSDEKSSTIFNNNTDENNYNYDNK